MTSLFRFPVLAALTLLLTACVTSPIDKTARIVNSAQSVVEKMKHNKELRGFNDALKNAQGVAVFPTVIKGGFFVGAEAGDGVLLARDASGTWGYPAFYTLAAGSFGFQFGGQAAEVVLIIRNRKAVEAVIKHQGKLGADISAAAGTKGVGYEGSVTTNLGLDVVVYSSNAGLFAGTSLEGTAFIRRNDFNQAYYGAEAAPLDIVLGNQHQNAAADGLRAALSVP